MKRKSNLYENIYCLENIFDAFDEICKNTRNKRKVRNYREYKCIYVSRVYSTLKNKNYVVGPYNVFTIYEPKQRRIVSQTMHDKIINHLVSRHILYPALLPCLVDVNVASRKNMGTKKGVELATNYHKICRTKYEKYYILKCDISKFFASIDHNILKQKLKRKIKDKDALNIVFSIIDSDEAGLSIGNMTSQVLAIFYLNDFDHFVKEQLKIKYYVRYQDDFLLFHQSKSYLKYCLLEIQKFLSKEKLTLNSKSRIYTSNNNFTFLGRNKKGKYVRYRNVSRKLNKKLFQYKSGYINLCSILSSMACYKHLCPSKVQQSLNKFINN
ncbi:MAG: reverse transcriptase domain-containing protein [Clostridia bacterium]